MKLKKEMTREKRCKEKEVKFESGSGYQKILFVSIRNEIYNFYYPFEFVLEKFVCLLINMKTQFV